jgi:hypothetical protein
LISSRVTRRRLAASLAQRVKEALAIRIIHYDQFAPVTTIHDVRQQTRLSICGPCRESGFGRYTYQYQEPTPLRPLYKDVLTRLPSMTNRQLVVLLPANWRRMHPPALKAAA